MISVIQISMGTLTPLTLSLKRKRLMMRTFGTTQTKLKKIVSYIFEVYLIVFS